METTITAYIYAPLHDWQPPRKRQRCAYAVHARGREVGDPDYAKQCVRKPHDYVHGFGFCTQHAQIIRRVFPSESP